MMISQQLITLSMTTSVESCAKIVEAMIDNPGTTNMDARTALRIAATAMREANKTLTTAMGGP